MIFVRQARRLAVGGRGAGCAWLALVLATVAQTASAAVLSVPANTVITGSSGQLAVSIDNATGVEGADLRFSFDPTIVTVSGEVSTTQLTSGCVPLSNTTTPGLLATGLACPQALSGGGVLFTIPLQVQGPGSTAFSVTSCVLEEGAIPCTPSSGNVSVPTPTSTATQPPTATATATPTPFVVLNPIASPVVVGGTATFTGQGFTAGSVIIGFVSSSAGTQKLGPFTPRSWSPTQLVWDVPTSVPLASGYAVFAVVNTDQGYIGSAYQGAFLYGNAATDQPTILGINGNALRPPDGAMAAVYVSTPILPGQTVTLTGTGFNAPGVNFYTSAGNLGPLWPLAGATATQMQLLIPSTAPLGLGAFEVVNSPYAGNVASQTVFVPIGNPPTLTGVTQSGSTITVRGTGFASGAVLNFFAPAATGGVANFGGSGLAVTVVSSTELDFTLPAGTAPGTAYVQVINPPYIALTSSGNDPHGGFTLQ